MPSFERSVHRRPVLTQRSHVDHLNTPRLIADVAGATVWQWDQQEPFGSNWASENPGGAGLFDMPLRFPGQYFDKETAVHYNYFRNYESLTGRYVESDPVGLLGGLNTYGYAESQPLKHIDPAGLFVDLYLQGGIGGTVHILGGGMTASCGPLVSVGATCQFCRWCTVCVRLGPGLYAGAGGVAGGGIAFGDVSSIGGYSIGAGGDIGFGGSAGASVGVGVSGDLSKGEIGSPTGVGGVKGRIGGGYGISGGLEICKTDLKCFARTW